MLIRVSDIQDAGLTVDDPTALGAPYSDPAWRLEGVRLHLECDQADVLVTGEIRATVPQICGRCLEPFPAAVRAAVDVRVVPRPTTGDSGEPAAGGPGGGVCEEGGGHTAAAGGAGGGCAGGGAGVGCRGRRRGTASSSPRTTSTWTSTRRTSSTWRRWSRP